MGKPWRLLFKDHQPAAMNKTTLYAAAMLAVVAVVGAKAKTKRLPMSLMPHKPEEPDMWEPGVLPLAFDYPDMVDPDFNPTPDMGKVPEENDVVQTIEYCKELLQNQDDPDDIKMCIMALLDKPKYTLTDEDCTTLMNFIPLAELPADVIEECNIIEPEHTLGFEEANIHPEAIIHNLNAEECEKVLESLLDPDAEAYPPEVLEACQAMIHPTNLLPIHAIHEQQPFITLNPDCEQLMQNPDHSIENFPADVIEECAAQVVQQMAEKGVFSMFISDLGHWVCSYFKSLFGI